MANRTYPFFFAHSTYLPYLHPQSTRDLLARVGELGAAELGAALTQYGVKAPDTKNDISEPFPFNLMFKCAAS